MKKFICLLLILAMVAIPFVACADNKNNPADSGAVGSNNGDQQGGEDNLVIPSNAAEAYKGKEFNMMYGTNPSKTYNYYLMYFEDAPTDDFYAQALHKRNLTVQEKLGITITGKSFNCEDGSVGSAFQQDVDGNNNFFHVCFNNMPGTMTQITSGRVLSLDNLPYVALSKAWWNTDSAEQLAIAGKSYCAAGDIMISDKECLWAMYFIKSRIKDKGLESPYDLVNNNQWTWDKMYEMAWAVHDDADGNDVMQQNSNDVFGLCTHGENYAACWESAGIKSTTNNSNGIPEFTWGSDKFLQVYEEADELMGDKMVVSPDNIDYISTAIMKNQTLFGTEVIAFVRQYRDSDTSFGILPYPKYDASVDRFNTYVAVNSAVASVGFTNPDAEYISVVLETMAYYGRQEIIPVYYEQQLKSRYSSDEESSSMLDIIFTYRCYDLGIFISGKDFGIDGVLTGSAVKPGSADPQRLWTRSQKRVNANLETMLDKLTNG